MKIARSFNCGFDGENHKPQRGDRISVCDEVSRPAGA
jgi:hypothetical protein